MRNHLDDIQVLDPIDGAGLDASWSTSEAKVRMFEAINDAASSRAVPRPSARRPVRRSLALAAALAAAGVAVVVVTGSIQRSGTPAFAVRPLPGGVIEIENVTDLEDAEGLEAELREFGVDAEIVTRAVSPTLVGMARATTDDLGERPLPGLTFGADGTPGVFTWRIDPHTFEGRITIELYVDGDAGEGYYLSEEVFEPGEVLGGLHCALGRPLQAGDVASRLPELGLTGQWIVLTGFGSGEPGATSSSEEVATVPDGEIVSGYAVDDRTVTFEVLPAGLDAPRWFERRLSDVPCTQEQAARWR